MSTTQQTIQLNINGRGIYDITDQINEICLQTNVESGLCHLFCPHTSASLIICENYDPDVKQDVETFFAELVKDGDPRFTHTIEGKDDMPAHVRSLLTQTSLSIPIVEGKLGLGQWQGICFYEHRLQKKSRSVIVTVL